MNNTDPLFLDRCIFNLDFLEEMLGSLGAQIIKAKSGEQSLSILKSAILQNDKEKIPKFILMDCRMPKMDGWTASRLMKEMMMMKELGKEIPIIGVTGDDKQQSQERLKGSGMDEILQKPIQKEELQNLMNKYA